MTLLKVGKLEIEFNKMNLFDIKKGAVGIQAYIDNDLFNQADFYIYFGLWYFSIVYSWDEEDEQ